MPLPMTVRKSIKDAEKERDERLAKIEKATGKKFEVEVDWETEFAALDNEVQKQNPGALYYGEILGAFATNVANTITKGGDTAKAAFNAATSANKIVIRVKEDQTDYWAVAFEGGKVVCLHKKGKIDATNSLSYFQMEKVMPAGAEGGLPVAVKLEVEKEAKEIARQLDRIKTALGVEYTVPQAEYENLYKGLNDSDKSRGLGWNLGQILGALATNLTNNVSKDDMVKEAWLEVTAKHTITFKHVPAQKDDWVISFDNGAVVLNFGRIGNVNSLSYFQIVKIL